MQLDKMNFVTEPMGIVRQIDSLGRIVIPKEYLRQLDLAHGSPVEILMFDKKYILIQSVKEKTEKD